MHFMRFLAACYLTFRLDQRDVASALDALPSHHILHQATRGGHVSLALPACLCLWLLPVILRKRLAGRLNFDAQIN